jgi:hypothetical protein
LSAHTGEGFADELFRVVGRNYNGDRREIQCDDLWLKLLDSGVQ